MAEENGVTSKVDESKVPRATGEESSSSVGKDTPVDEGDTDAKPPAAGLAKAVQLEIVSTASKSSSRGGRHHRSISPVPDAVTAAGLAQASQLVSSWGYHGVATLLTAQLQPNRQQQQAAAAAAAAAAASLESSSNKKGSNATGGGGSGTGGNSPHPALLPTVAQVQLAASKAVLDTPPWIHWNKVDMAPQLRVTDSGRLHLTGPLRGYRMARASHGCSTGCYYFECRIQPGPSAEEIVNNLPPNARLGPGLQEQLQAALKWEEAKKAEKQQQDKLKEATTTTTVQNEKEERETSSSSTSGRGGGRKRKLDNSTNGDADDKVPPQVGGHLRIGWSMRTGDLQAPVGYDKWSYGIRCSTGSIIHESHRQDIWGGEGMEAGDILGCAICLRSPQQNDTATSSSAESNEKSGGSVTTDNHIRFFKNGQCMGEFVISKGKRVGGEAFSNLESGTYYPAASCYMGGSVKVNFGPHWVYPPKKLPPGLKLAPLSDLCPPPMTAEEVLSSSKLATAVKLFRKADQQRALKEAIVAEAEILCQAHDRFIEQHVRDVRQEREDRGLSVQDLPEVVVETTKTEEAMDTSK